MLLKRDNYAIQANTARLRFLTYDPKAILQTTAAESDGDFLCLHFCGADYRISRSDGHIFRCLSGQWISSESHGEALTIYNYLCDAKPDRTPSGEFATISSMGGHVHRQLALRSGPLEHAIDRDPQRFRKVCLALGASEDTGSDLCYRMDLFPDLPVLLRFWHSDEDFPPKLDILWDRNSLQYLLYETLWYADGVLRNRLFEGMKP